MSWKAEAIKHKGEKRIAVYFEKNAEWIARIKKLDNARWSASLKAKCQNVSGNFRTK